MTARILRVLVPAGLFAGLLCVAVPAQAQTGWRLDVVAGAGYAAVGNSLPADILVLVSKPTGEPVPNLTISNFKVINHFSVPGQTCGFSNNITSFTYVGSGTYQLQVSPVVDGCTWVPGEYLLQVVVTKGRLVVQYAQAAAKFYVGTIGAR